MSILDEKVIDGIASTSDGLGIGLFLADHLEWTNEQINKDSGYEEILFNEHEHLMLLQNKINSYIDFFENKQYEESYKFKNNRFQYGFIAIHFKYELTENAKKFLKVAQAQISPIGLEILYCVTEGKSKELSKKLLEEIETMAINKDFKPSVTTKSIIYKIINDNFIFVRYNEYGAHKIAFKVYIKKCSYDEIFWEITDNNHYMRGEDSYRVFSAPPILIKSQEYEISEDIDSLIEQFFNEIETSINIFLENNNIDEYIINNENFPDCKVLKCLAYININQEFKAIEIAKNELEKDLNAKLKYREKEFFKNVIESYHN